MKYMLKNELFNGNTLLYSYRSFYYVSIKEREFIIEMLLSIGCKINNIQHYKDMHNVNNNVVSLRLLDKDVYLYFSKIRNGSNPVVIMDLNIWIKK